MASLASHPGPAPTSNDVQPLPRLMPGDHLDRATFHARYTAMPPDTRAELVGGIVYMSPLDAPHGRMRSEVIAWLTLYKGATPGLEVQDNCTVILADDGEPQPDACLTLPAEHGGQTHLDEEECIVGAPELVVEVAYSSDSFDLHSKKRDYERAGVREDVVVTLREPRVLWFALRGERLEEQAPAGDGYFHSGVFPGLWLDPSALLRRDTNAVRAALERGLTTSEHTEFTHRLNP